MEFSRPQSDFSMLRLHFRAFLARVSRSLELSNQISMTYNRKQTAFPPEFRAIPNRRFSKIPLHPGFLRLRSRRSILRGVNISQIQGSKHTEGCVSIS